jgi:hypothetical protein
MSPLTTFLSGLKLWGHQLGNYHFVLLCASRSRIYTAALHSGLGPNKAHEMRNRESI